MHQQGFNGETLFVPHALDFLDDIGPVDRIIGARGGGAPAQQFRLTLAPQHDVSP